MLLMFTPLAGKPVIQRTKLAYKRAPERRADYNSGASLGPLTGYLRSGG
jgi:hypothetical protein